MTREGPRAIARTDWAQFIAAHQVGVWRYLRALGCESALADDLTQDTFLTVLKRPLEEVHPAATAAYLRKVAHNLFINFQRRAGRMIVTEDLDQLAVEWDELVRGDDSGEELLVALRDCLKGLTDRAREALSLRFVENRSRAEIAAALSIGEHGAKNLMQRAKSQLRDCLKQKRVTTDE